MACKTKKQKQKTNTAYVVQNFSCLLSYNNQTNKQIVYPGKLHCGVRISSICLSHTHKTKISENKCLIENRKDWAKKYEIICNAKNESKSFKINVKIKKKQTKQNQHETVKHFQTLGHSQTQKQNKKHDCHKNKNEKNKLKIKIKKTVKITNCWLHKN